MPSALNAKIEVTELCMNKGHVYKHLKPKECVNCGVGIKLGAKAMHLDQKVHTESGWLPCVTEKDEHWIWLFCSAECLLAYVGDPTKREGMDK